MSERHDFYGPIHKGLRLGSSRLLIELGALDWNDEAQRVRVLGALKTHLVLARQHLEHEDHEIMPALLEQAPGMAAVLEHDHEDHYETFAALDGAIARVEAAMPAQRTMHGRSLYLRFSRYFADDLLHMAREEMEALPLFHALFTDAQLQEMEGKIIASITPERLTEYYMIMIPGMSPPERAAFVAYVRAVAPPEGFAHLMETARAALTPEAFRLLDNQLARAA